ncbi:MAG: MFS transporter, partial [Verrucomicrobia bacterium]|nr:MFS transporter [Verrucomicrobiota bacterium]
MPSHASSSAPKSKKDHWLVLVAAFLGWLFDGFEIGLFPVVARPALKGLLGNPPDQLIGEWMGIITAVFLVGAAVGGALFGWLGDRIGRVRAMSLSILCYSLFSGAGYFAEAPWHLAVFRFIAALGMGGEWALGVALVMEVWPEKHRPWLAGMIGAAANLGMVLVGVIAFYVKVTPTSWRWMFLVGAAPAVLTLLVRLFVPESEQWRESVKDKKAEPFKELLQSPFLGRTLIGVALASVALIGTWGSVQWIPLWVDQLTGGTMPTAKASAQMTSSLGAVFGSLLIPILLGPVSRRWGYFMICAASLLVCGWLFRSPQEYGASMLWMIAAAGFVTASFYGWFPLYFPELFPARMRATGQGMCFNMGRVI